MTVTFRLAHIACHTLSIYLHLYHIKKHSTIMSCNLNIILIILYLSHCYTLYIIIISHLACCMLCLSHILHLHIVTYYVTPSLLHAVSVTHLMSAHRHLLCHIQLVACCVCHTSYICTSSLVMSHSVSCMLCLSHILHLHIVTCYVTFS